MTYQEYLISATENNGNFTVAPNDTTEIDVCFSESFIRVKTYRFKNQLTPTDTTLHSSLFGIFGRPSMEDTFNKIMSEIKK
jgi:hypothetical protein